MGYSLRGVLSAIPPTQVCLFVGNFSCISGNLAPNGIVPRNRIDYGVTEKSKIFRVRNITGYSTFKLMLKPFL